ncbi:MAG TPA: glutamine amidotransferase [Stellaceae bacterium]|jgi:GMP synthase (glutamine-hydrolysing)|nr:glutamine amidotransferase [Stellaceae bacterium]
MGPGTALAIRHVPFEDLGSFASVLRERGFAVAYRDAGLDDLGARDLIDADLLIVLGGPIGVYETTEYPFLKGEIAVVERRLKAGRPVLGLCLGAQIMAKALGARVYHGKRKELGWSPLTLTDAGSKSALAELGARTAVLHWHGDTFDLPRESELLASTRLYANQAFSWRQHALGLQFHIEATTRGLERWFVGHALEIASTRGVDLVKLRRETRRLGPRLEERGPRVLKAWLDRLGF